MKNSIIAMFVLFGFSTEAQPSASSETVSDPTTVIKTFFDAYRGHDRDKVNSLIHPEVVWVQPGSNRISGVKRSREELLAMGRRMGELSDNTIHLEEVRILNATGNSVACLLRWKAVQPIGTVLDVENIDVYTIENGLIVNVKVYSSDLAQEDKFWGSK